MKKALFIAVLLFTLSLTSYAEQPKPPYKQDYYIVVSGCRLVNYTYNAGNYFENDWKIRYYWEHTYKAYPVYTH